eukprot:11294222-Prorocentrum_lima.AAC.1
MTSSLVGSEMCIRDRGIDAADKARHRAWLLNVWLLNDANGELQDTISPVSYTHLTLPTICSV